MKKLVLAICLVAVIMLLFASGAVQQVSEVPVQEVKTKLEAFEYQTGTVIIRGYSKISSVSGMGTVDVDCMEFTNVSSAVRDTGIVIEVKPSGKYASPERSFIDYDEIEPLLSGIDYISKVTIAAIKLEMFEATYKTEGGFSVGVYNTKTGEIGAVVKSDRAAAYFDTTKLNVFKDIIIQAKKKLDEIKSN